MKLQNHPTARIAEVIAAVAAGETRPAVAARYGMSVSAVEQAVNRWHGWKPPVAAPFSVQHRCLQCREVFAAEARGNWICATCKSAERWRA
jgi:transposase